MIHSRAFRTHTHPRERYVCSLAAAVLGASAVGAGASIWGANKAAGAQTDASNAAIANQREMYGKNADILKPFIDAGAGGIDRLRNWIDPTSGSNPLASLIKLVTPGADMSATLAQTPGFQFSQTQGTRAALNALAARGLGGSPGAVAKGVGNYVTGLAGNTWDSVVKNLLSTFGAGTNALQGMVNTGVTAGSSLAGVGTNTANSITGSLTGAGNAQAAGYNATGAAVGNGANSLTTAALLQQLTGKNGGGGGIYGDPSMGGNDVWGGSSKNPLAGLTPDDYGAGF